MAHRMYLYNLAGLPDQAEQRQEEGIDTLLAGYGTNGEGVCLMMEWGYELPLLLQPLFAGPIELHAPAYNGTEGGLYAPAPEGLTALRALYRFIDQHQATLIERPAGYETAKEKLFRYLDREATYPLFHLDAWDVFNVSDDGSEGNHHAQATELAACITANNAAIQQAIAANDPALLDRCPAFTEGDSYHHGFRAMLNDEAYDYGWGVIASAQPHDDHPVKIFRSGARYGLQDAEGRLLAPAEYDAIQPFPWNGDLAVAVKNGRAGYLHSNGHLAIPCTFDEAGDFNGEWAEVKQNGKFAVIGRSGAYLLPPLYENGHMLAGNAAAVQHNGRWGIADLQGNVHVPFSDAADISALHTGGQPVFKVTAAGGESTLYSHTFTRLATGRVTDVLYYNDHYIVALNRQYGLVSAAGETLLPFAHTAIDPAYELGGLIVSKGKTKGYYVPGRGWQLPCDYSDIYPLAEAAESDGTVYAVVKQDKRCGLFAAGKKNSWIFPVEYEGMRWIKKGVLAYRRQRLWGLARNTGERITEALYTSINGKYGELTYGTALGFTHTGVTVISHNGAGRTLSAQEAKKELKNGASAYFSKQEISALQQLANPSLAADDLYHKGQRALEKAQYQQAIRCFEQAAALGHAASLTDLGFIYETAEQYMDYDRAFAYYQQAAQKGDLYGMNNLGLAFLYGRGTPADTTQALHWLQQAADKGHTRALYSIGDLYYRPEFAIEDHATALDYYYRAFVAGEDVGVFMGDIYERREDYANALFYYRDAAGKGSAYAQWRLGCFHTDGNGVDTDLHEAMAYYQQAAPAQPEAHVDIAILYMSTTFYDPGKAREHLDAAEAAGVAYAADYRRQLQL